MENQEIKNVNEETKGELTLFSGIKQNIYCSKVAETEKEKKELFNALESCDALLNDCVGQEIEIQDLYIEEKQVIDEETGELKTKYRTILFDKSFGFIIFTVHFSLFLSSVTCIVIFNIFFGHLPFI